MRFTAKIFALLLLSFPSILSAQNGLDIDINLDTREWYENPLVWVIAGLVLIVLVLLARKSK